MTRLCSEMAFCLLGYIMVVVNLYRLCTYFPFGFIGITQLKDNSTGYYDSLFFELRRVLNHAVCPVHMYNLNLLVITPIR